MVNSIDPKIAAIFVIDEGLDEVFAHGFARVGWGGGDWASSEVVQKATGANFSMTIGLIGCG